MMKARQLAALVTAIAAACAVSGCSVIGGTAARTALRHRTTSHAVLTANQTALLREFGASDTGFGIGLLGAVCRSSGTGNIVLSPVSVASSLGLALLGARGATATAMEEAMGLPAESPASLVAGLGVRSALLGSLHSPGVTFTQGNRIWADKALRTRPAYISALKNAYQAAMAHVPLLTDPEQARHTINAAISRQTRGHILDLLAPGSLDGSTGWVLTNALYLKAAWADPFEHARTSKGPFSAESGQVTASYLNGDGFKTASYAGFTAVSLPYKGGRLRMLALLPDAKQRFPVTEPRQPAGRSRCVLPEAGQLRTVETKLAASHRTVDLALPKVKLAWSGSLRQPLTSLGMGSAFTPAADFSAISPQACCIGFVQHAATLSVGEKGTVASAATATGITATALAPSVPLRFDRPYLLVIDDARTGEPLMLAWVANPAQS